MHNFGLSDAEANQLNSYMPFNSTLAMKDLSFRSMPSLELHQQKVVYGLWQSQLQKMNRPPGQDEESGIPMNFNET